MKYTKAEVDVIRLDNIDIVTYSGCDEGTWYNDAPEEVYEGCVSKPKGQGFISACKTSSSPQWTHYDKK